MRKNKPFASDILKQLEELHSKISPLVFIVLLGDLNCKLGRNIEKLTSSWFEHKKTNSEGKKLFDMMLRINLTIIPTYFQPNSHKTNATYLAKDPKYKPSQIDYILISSRWSKSEVGCLVSAMG